MRTLSIILIAIAFFGCQEEKKAKQITLSPEQKIKLMNFAHKMENGIMSGDYDVFHKHWNEELLKMRMGKLSKRERVAFKEYYNKHWKFDVNMANLDLINAVKYNEGKIEVTKIDSFSTHVEGTYAYQFSGEKVDFVKYRFELKDSSIVISDRYDFRNEVWLSKNIKKFIRDWTEVPLTAPSRIDYFNNLAQYDRNINDGKYNNALNYLNQIPKPFSNYYSVSLMKLETAIEVSPELYHRTLEEELKYNKFEYLKYLRTIALESDEAKYNEYFASLSKKVGPTSLVDSLYTGSYYW